MAVSFPRGLAVIAQQIPLVFIIIKWAGVAYLAWLAWKAWSADVNLAEGRANTRTQSRTARIAAGLAVTMGNPKAMLFYVALLPSLVDAESLSVGAVVPLYVGVVVILSLSFTAYSLAAEAARKTMTSAKAVRRANRTTASALGGAAVWIASR